MAAVDTLGPHTDHHPQTSAGFGRFPKVPLPFFPRGKSLPLVSVCCFPFIRRPSPWGRSEAERMGPTDEGKGSSAKRFSLSASRHGKAPGRRALSQSTPACAVVVLN